MRLIFFILMIYLGVCPIHAQLVGITQKFQNLPSPLPKSIILDTTKLVVLFQCSYPTDNFQDGFQKVKDILCFQIGKKICKTFSQNLYLWDRNLTYQEENSVRFRMDYINYTIFSNYPTGYITEENRIPNSRLLQGATQVVSYIEPTPTFQWELFESKDSILGYHCQIAKCSFRGREWTVWYTPQIPSILSIWKFSGLPGLILKAEDSTGDYCFEAISIASKSVPIEMHQWKPIKKTRSQWRKIEANMYEHPADYFLSNKEISVLGQKNQEEISTEEWSVRYNPIEKE